MKRLFVAAALALMAQPALAETPKPAPATPSPTPTPETSAPYEPQLLRLSEIFGALTYLRDLCGPGDGAAFRDRMGKLIEIEAEAPERKETLAGAFNRGFADYELTYRRCTPSARETIADYLEESARLARDVATRYGG